MSFDYSLKPINKTAALVTSQSGCASDDTLSDEQLRENLVAKSKVIETRLQALPKGSAERKKLGKEKVGICLQISKLRPKRRCKSVTDHVLDILREEMTDFQFKQLISKASKRADEALLK